MTQTIETTPKSASRRGRKILAGGAIAAILLAGGGTYAAWQQTALAEAGQIQTVAVTISAHEGTWIDHGKNAYFDPETYRVGSNEKLTYSQTLSIDSAGSEGRMTVNSIPENVLRAVFPTGSFKAEIVDRHTGEAVDAAAGMAIPGGAVDAPYEFKLTIDSGDDVRAGQVVDLDNIQYVATATE